MKMNQGLDTGDVMQQRSLAIDPAWSSADLHDALAPLGAELMLEALQDIESAMRLAQPQDDSRATYAPRLSKQQAQVDWRKPAAALLREIHAFNPGPVSFSFLEGDSIRFWDARAGRHWEACSELCRSHLNTMPNAPTSGALHTSMWHRHSCCAPCNAFLQ